MLKDGIVMYYTRKNKRYVLCGHIKIIGRINIWSFP